MVDSNYAAELKNIWNSWSPCISKLKPF